MWKIVLSNLAVNMRFFKRNKLLFGIGIFIVLIPALFSIPGFLISSSGNRLNSVLRIYSQMSDFALVLGPGTVLLFFSHHIRGRVLKMVFTKPFTPETWLLIGFSSSALISMIVFSLAVLLCESLLLLWGLSFQWGLLYMALKDFSHALMWIFYVGFLAVIFHPAIALLFVFFFREESFYYVKRILEGLVREKWTPFSEVLIKGLKALVDLIYFLLPTFTPYRDQTAGIYSNLRLTPAAVKYLFLSLNYAVVVSFFFYFLSVIFLKRKRLL